ncbi:ImmA/IrrE family metallo-endopeptidase, partial [Streptococcus suis]|nr:ImmA/IrrE family metallo-endopeptidase [Streptococcus suis]
DRNMIHYLVKEELSLLEDTSEFNYVRFMEKYDLKTTVNETMVIEEYNGMVG